MEIRPVARLLDQSGRQAMRIGLVMGQLVIHEVVNLPRNVLREVDYSARTGRTYVNLSCKDQHASPIIILGVTHNVLKGERAVTKDEVLRNMEERLSALCSSLELGRSVELLHMALEFLKRSGQNWYRTKVNVITGQSVQLSSERSLEGSTVSAAAKSDFDISHTHDTHRERIDTLRAAP